MHFRDKGSWTLRKYQHAISVQLDFQYILETLTFLNEEHIPFFFNQNIVWKFALTYMLCIQYKIHVSQISLNTLNIKLKFKSKGFSIKNL